MEQPMERLRNLITHGEDWIMRRLLIYTTTREYSKYSSTLEEAWRVSVRGLSAPLIKAAEMYDSAPELHPDEDFTEDPIASFGIVEAQRHRERGVSLAMFLGLLKYYRQTYVDLVEESDIEEHTKRKYRLFVERFFDRVEIGVSVEWARGTDQDNLTDLQSANRFLANEKNKYLTIFESLSNPAFLLDKEHRIDNLNRAASGFLGRPGAPGSEYYCLLRDRRLEYIELEQDGRSPVECLQGESAGEILPWLRSELIDFAESEELQKTVEATAAHNGGMTHFSVSFSRMRDISGKFAGTLIVLDDITARKKAEESLRETSRLNQVLIDSMPCVALLVRPSTREIVAANAAAVKVGAVPGTQCIDTWGRRGEPCPWRLAPAAWRTGEAQHMEVEADGTVLDAYWAPVSQDLYMHYAFDITEQRRAEEKIKASLVEKEVLLREIHHRVKNNLAVINSLVNLQSRFAGQKSPQELLSDIQSRIRCMALAHELLYQSENLAEVSVSRYLRSLLAFLNQSISTVGTNIDIVKELDNISFGLDTAVPLGFIVTELVSNSLKHAFAGRTDGQIKIAFRAVTDGDFELVVADNGVGYPEGIDIKNPVSVGLELVSAFVEQLHGVIIISRDQGAEVRVRFKER
jgi:two-component sensor histidine kinase